MKSTTQKYLCWLWIILLTTLAAVGFFRADADKIETDIQALLPQTTGTASAAKVLRTLSNNIAADVFLLISASEISNTQSAAQIVYQELSKMGFTPSSPADDISPKLIREIFLAYRENFLTAEDRAWLASSDDQALLSRALRILYRPISNNLLGPSDDPLGLFQNWLNSRTQQTSFTIRGPWLMVSSENTDYVVLRIRRTNAISADASLSLTHAIESASSIAKETIPSAQVLAAGMPLIAENTAAQAARESSLIGGISTLGILALTLVFLGRIRPVLTILGTLTIAVTIAFSVTFISFGSIHIITLVFGATLLGVCVDYIFHYLLTPADKHSLLFRSLTLSLCSTLIGYLLMAFSPMSSLQQMATFCVTGLVSTFLTVYLIFPHNVLTITPTAYAARFAQFMMQLPRLRGETRYIVLAGLSICIATGIAQIKTGNELAQINVVSAELLQKQNELSRILNPSSPSQFYLISATDEQRALDLMKTLETKLSQACEKGVLSGFSMPNKFILDRETQYENQAIVSQANARALLLLQEEIGVQLPPPKLHSGIMSTQYWIQSVKDSPLASLWLSPSSAIVMLKGVTADKLTALQEIANKLDGVEFINSTGDIAQALTNYRTNIIWLILASVIAVTTMLMAIFGKHFWRYLCPMLFGIGSALAYAGLSGSPLSLFTVLPLVLLIGLGVDYAIVLYSDVNSSNVWISTTLAASSTLLAFGLLAFSSTPALHQFGISLLVGLTTVWILTILLRPECL